MKKIKIILILFCSPFLLFNCNHNENENLKSKLDELKNINTKLIDSIKQMEYLKIISTEMIILPQNEDKFSGMLFNRFKDKNFNLYQTDTLHFIDGVNRKLIYKNHSNPQFEVKIDPKSIKDNTLYLLAEYDLDSLKVQISGVYFLK